MCRLDVFLINCRWLVNTSETEMERDRLIVTALLFIEIYNSLFKSMPKINERAPKAYPIFCKSDNCFHSSKIFLITSWYKQQPNNEMASCFTSYATLPYVSELEMGSKCPAALIFNSSSWPYKPGGISISNPALYRCKGRTFATFDWL